jgi:hypothetical protein
MEQRSAAASGKDAVWEECCVGRMLCGKDAVWEGCCVGRMLCGKNAVWEGTAERWVGRKEVCGKSHDVCE